MDNDSSLPIFLLTVLVKYDYPTSKPKTTQTYSIAEELPRRVLALIVILWMEIMGTFHKELSDTHGQQRKKGKVVFLFLSVKKFIEYDRLLLVNFPVVISSPLPSSRKPNLFRDYIQEWRTLPQLYGRVKSVQASKVNLTPFLVIGLGIGI